MDKGVHFIIGYVIGVFCLVAVQFGIGVLPADDEPTRQPLVIPPNHMHCPEDADLVVRYGVEPAGEWAFCVASDDLERLVLP